MEKKEIQRWFNERREELGDDKTKQIAVWFSSRCALRVAPIAFFKKIEKDKKSLTIAVLWSTTASWVASNRATHNASAVASAAAAAASNAASNAATDDAFDAAAVTAADPATAISDDLYAAYAAAGAFHADASVSANGVADAAYAAYYAAITYAAAFAVDADDNTPTFISDATADTIASASDAAVYAATAAEEDLKWLEQSDYQIAESSPPLWHDAPNPLKEIWKRGRNYWQEAPGNPYALFIDHYDRILRGDVPDWPILEALASKEAIEVWRTKDIHQIADYIQKLKIDRGGPHI